MTYPGDAYPMHDGDEEGLWTKTGDGEYVTEASLLAPRLAGEVKCPCCGEMFDKSDWGELRSYDEFLGWCAGCMTCGTKVTVFND